MSRPPPKSRGDKAASRGAAAAATAGAPSVAAVAPVSNDIVPGRLTETEWLRLLAEDDDCNFVGSIVDEILDTTLNKCYEKYIWKQLIPYTVNQAKDSILQVVEWHFLSRDVGETDIATNMAWKEDSEPEAGVIDSWAQGSVPVVVRPQSSLAASVSAMSEEHTTMPEPSHQSPQPPEDSIGYETEQATSVSEQPLETKNEVGEQPAKTAVKTPRKPKGPPPEKAISEATSFGPDSNGFVKKKKRTYKRHTGRLPPLSSTELNTGNENNKQEPPTNDKDGMHLSPSQKSLIKSQAGRPPGNREVTFDERGNVIGVMKLNVHNLPTHKVRVQYAIVDPIAEANLQKFAGMRNMRGAKKQDRSDQAKSVDTKKTGTSSRYRSEVSSSYKSRDLAVTVQQFPPGIDSLVRSNKGSKSTIREKRIQGARIDPLPPLLIETIDASPGVVIQEGEHIKKGPEETFPSTYRKNIRASGSLLRLVGDKLFQSQVRPALDPSEVVKVDETQKQVQYAVPPGIQSRPFERTAET